MTELVTLTRAQLRVLVVKAHRRWKLAHPTALPDVVQGLEDGMAPTVVVGEDVSVVRGELPDVNDLTSPTLGEGHS